MDYVSYQKLALIIVPIYLLIIGLIFAVAFTYVYILDIQPSQDANGADYMVILGLESMSLDTFLIHNTLTYTSLLTFYEEAHESPYLDISYTYTNEPTGLSFRIVDENGTVVSGSPSTVTDYNSFVEVRYPFINNESKYYSLEYILGSDDDNAENVAIVRIELKGPVLAS